LVIRALSHVVVLDKKDRDEYVQERDMVATMEVGRSGRSMMSAGAGASYGVIDNRSENLQH
jgi:PHP family Zn ribbon phosphoesterase